MGRSLGSQSTSDLFNRSNLTKKEKALQNGSPKWLPAGEARACYAMLSMNTTQGQGGVAFYDKYFEPVRASGMLLSSPNNNLGNHHHAGAGDLQVLAGLFAGVVHAGSAIASGTSLNSLNATVSTGEFGHTYLDVYSNSTASPAGSRGNDTMNKTLLNRCFVDSDHQDRSICYINQGQVLRAVNRVYGDSRYNAPNTKHVTLADMGTTGFGMMSYNSKRKELIGIATLGQSGNMRVITYSNVDFDRYPSPHIALARPEVVKTIKTLATITGWVANNIAEAQYNLKPVLCDDGSIFVSAMFVGYSLTLYKFTRTAALDITTSVIGARTITTTYGYDTIGNAGQHKMQSRDGTAVLTFCQYYYYGAGMLAWLIDKTKSVSINATWIQDANSSAGVMPIPYGDNGFASYMASNGYASNPSGSYILGAVERDGDGDYAQTSSAFALPYFTLPNTTNCPGFTQVVDYSMLDNQTLV